MKFRTFSSPFIYYDTDIRTPQGTSLIRLITHSHENYPLYTDNKSLY